jgi:hypothetical protein
LKNVKKDDKKMRGKLIALFVGGIFLFSCIFSLTTVGKKLNNLERTGDKKVINFDTKEENINEDGAKGSTCKPVNFGEVIIYGDGTSESWINISVNEEQTVSIRGITIAAFTVNCDITKVGVEDVVEIVFRLSICNSETVRTYNAYNVTLNHSKKNLIIFKLVKPEDEISFTIKATYISDDVVITKSASGGGKIIEKENISNSLEDVVIKTRFCNKKLTLIRNLLQKFPILNQLL